MRTATLGKRVRKSLCKVALKNLLIKIRKTKIIKINLLPMRVLNLQECAKELI